MVKTYRKGYAAENQLVHILYKRGYAVMRAPRSGRVDLPTPDIVAIKGRKVLVIECKSRKSGFTVEHEQLEQLNEWKKRTAGRAYIAWKRPRVGWFFLKLEDVIKNHGNVGKKFVEKYGINLDEL